MSQLDAKVETIDGATYEVRMLPATRAQKLLVRLGGMLGPAFAKLAGSADGQNEEVDAEAFGAAVTALFASADEASVDSVLKELAAVTLVDGKALAPIYDVHFAGRIGTLFKWATFALRVQFADFFDALASALNEAGLARAIPGSLSRTASTGPSGG